MMEIDFAKIEKKWQNRWTKGKVFEVDEKFKKEKFYVLEMFPYPSGEGLHMGHAFNSVIGDVFARFKIMNGFSVLHPMGYDALGLPAENAAIKVGTHPKDYTNKSIPNFMKQQKGLGLSYDWSRMINTADASYYKWDQWIFLKMLEKGLAYQKVSAVNWCSKCRTVLANEQAQNGACDLCGTKVEMKQLKQWFLRITDYADELYSNLDNMDWPERTKAMQRNWIGKSHGTEIDFVVERGKGKFLATDYTDSHGFGGRVSNVVIVHGANDSKKSAFEGGREDTRHWFPWIRKELAHRNIKFSSELYPEDWNPDYKEWKKVFEKSDINGNTILVGHSLGCGFILRWLSETKTKVKKVILVAPYVLNSPDLPGLKNMVSFELIKNLNKFSDEFVVYYSDDDNNFIIDSVDYLRKNIRGKFMEFKGTGHFVFDSMGTHEFPELLDEILSTNCANEREGVWKIFTTRPDTIFGVTFMVVAAQHPRLDELVTAEQRKDVEKFLKKIGSVSQKSMKDVEYLDKEGVFSGSYAVNPANGERVPIWIGNFVVADYGSGMVMAVPAHDQRDFEFAKKYGILNKQVIQNQMSEIRNQKSGDLAEAFTDGGKLINSGEFDGLNNSEAKDKISDWLIKKRLGRRVVNFKLRDWGISRQRYWGTPIPVVHCEKCGVVPVPEKDLPVKLPKDVKFGKGNPLESVEKWLNVKCPKCGGKARRESDTMDTFVNSSWYFLRYCDAHNDKKIFDVKKVGEWCPVDFYIGGAEHACMHLIYSRFYVKFLRDLGLIDFDEPAVRLFHQGMINDEKGEKMSKSKGNVVEPLETMAKYGVDTTRYFLLSMASPDKGFNWSDKEIMGAQRFVRKVYEFFERNEVKDMSDGLEDSAEVLSKLNLAIRDVGEGIEKMELRAVTIKLKELFNFLVKQDRISRDTRERALKLLVPFCPHVCEEIWEKFGGRGFVSLAEWPKAGGIKNGKKTEDLNGKIVEDVKEILSRIGKESKVVYVYVMPFEIGKVDVKKISKEIGRDVRVFSVADGKKYDPAGKAKRAKPGMASVYVE